MTITPLLADRTRKARRESQCPVCKGWITPGTLIARCGGLWMHAACLIAHRHDSTGEQAAPVPRSADYGPWDD